MELAFHYMGRRKKASEFRVAQGSAKYRKTPIYLLATLEHSGRSGKGLSGKEATGSPPGIKLPPSMAREENWS
jgi:hypothetical protein